MDHAKRRKHRLRPEPQRPRLPRMPRRAGIPHHLQILDRRADRGEQSQRLSLGVERVERLCLALLPAARAILAGKHDAERRMLAPGEIAPPDLEQPHARRTALHVALGRREQAGQQRRPHDLQLLADRIGERPGAATDRGRLRVRQEAPGQRLVEPARGGGATRAAFEALLGRGGRLGDARRARQRHGGDRVDPLDADDFLDQIGGAIDVAPRRRRQHGPVALDGEAERR